MLGKLIAKIRKDKNFSKTELANMTKIDIGHLTHIEKGERTPSHKSLKAICDALNVPYQPIMHTYDRVLTDDQISYNVSDHIKYDSIPVFTGIAGFTSCPKEFFNADYVIRSFDNSMYPKIKADDFIYIESNAPLDNKDFGLFQYDGHLLLRKFIVRKNDLVLRAEDNNIEDIIITKDSNFYIIGKVLGINNKNMSKHVVF